MWGVDDGWDRTLTGTHTPIVNLSAWYDGRLRQPVTHVAGSGQVRQTLDGGRVVTTLDVAIADPDGTLAPIADTDTLAPYGQELRLQVGVRAGAREWLIPAGRYRIDVPDPSGGWWLYRWGDVSRWMPQAGQVGLRCSDLAGRIVQDKFFELMAPRAGGTIRSEVARLCEGRVPVDTATIPATPVPGSLVYRDDVMANITDLLDRAGLVARMSRTGALEAVRATPGTPVWALRLGSTLGEVRYRPSREGIANMVHTKGETIVPEGGQGKPEPVEGWAQETIGALAATGPLGRIPYEHTSPLYTTQQAVQAGAETRLASLIGARQALLDVEMAWNPALEVPDTVTVELPGTPTTTVAGVLVDLAWSLDGGPMTGRVACDRKAVQAWVRR